MKTWLAWLSFLTASAACAAGAPIVAPGLTAVIIPIRDEIAPPLVYLVRRGVKQAIEEQAGLLVLDMKTNGGRIDTTEDIITILGEFKGETVTFVNDRAISAGVFISVATKKIYMAPQSVIGAAAPVMMGPGGQPQDIPGTMEIKTKSVVRALVRRVAEKNGHNFAVIESMIDKNKELKLDGQLHIFEATSRFSDRDAFVAGLKKHGFAIVEVRDAWKFTHIHAMKTDREPVADVELKF